MYDDILQKGSYIIKIACLCGATIRDTVVILMQITLLVCLRVFTIHKQQPVLGQWLYCEWAVVC